MAPVCSPTSYQINVGKNSSIDEVFASLNCNDPGGGEITYTVDVTSGLYFDFGDEMLSFGS